jgi:hypothetical protein
MSNNIPFPATVTVHQRTYTINTAPAWAQKKLQFFIGKNGGTNFDVARCNKAERRMVRQLCRRFGI